MGLSQPLKYPLPTTDSEVHQIRTGICEMFAAATIDGNLQLQIPANTRPEIHTAASGHVHRDTARKPSPNTAYPPFSAPHRVTHTRPAVRTAPGPATQAFPPRLNTHTRPPQTSPPSEPHSPPHPATHTHPPRRALRSTAHPSRPMTHTHSPHTAPKPVTWPPRAQMQLTGTLSPRGR